MKKQMEFEIGRLVSQTVAGHHRGLQSLGDMIAWLSEGDSIERPALEDIERARLAAEAEVRKLEGVVSKHLFRLHASKDGEAEPNDEKKLVGDLVDAGKGLVEIMEEDDLTTIKKHVRPEVVVALCEVLEPARELHDLKTNNEEVTRG